VRHPGFRWLSPGGVLAVAIWVIATALFSLYVANFGSSNKTYGALAGVVIFLVWLWVSNIAVLLGAGDRWSTAGRARQARQRTQGPPHGSTNPSDATS
jgi:membrane protein